MEVAVLDHNGEPENPFDDRGCDQVRPELVPVEPRKRNEDRLRELVAILTIMDDTPHNRRDTSP